MSDLRDQLDRQARRIDAGASDLAHVHHRAERLRTRRRITSAVVALAVGSAGLVLSYTAFAPGADIRRPAAPVFERNRALYPPPQSIADLQHDAEAGVAPEWLDPHFVAERFMEDVMGWAPEDAEIRLWNPDPMRVAIWNRTLTVTRNLHTILSMQRYQNRDDGIYTVMMAKAPDVEIDSPQPWDPIRPGQEIRVAGRLGFNHEGGGLAAEISATGGTLTTKGIPYQPEFEFTIEAPQKRAIAAEFAMFSAEGTTVAMTAFRVQGLGPQNEGASPPAAAPTPGPTPMSDDATPPPIVIEVEDGTAMDEVGTYGATFIESWGEGRHHGGYDSAPVQLADRPHAVTTIYFDPGFESEAERMREWLFPGAEITAQIPDDEVGLRVVVGEDFAERHAQNIEAFSLLQAFMDARVSGSGAEAFLSPRASRQFDQDPVNDPDPSLYRYAEGSTYDVHLGEAPIPISEQNDAGLRGITFHVTMFEASSTRCYTERLRVDAVDGRLEIIEAFLSMICEG